MMSGQGRTANDLGEEEEGRGLVEGGGALGVVGRLGGELGALLADGRGVERCVAGLGGPSLGLGEAGGGRGGEGAREEARGEDREGSGGAGGGCCAEGGAGEVGLHRGRAWTRGGGERRRSEREEERDGSSWPTRSDQNHLGLASPSASHELL